MPIRTRALALLICSLSLYGASAQESTQSTAYITDAATATQDKQAHAVTDDSEQSKDDEAEARWPDSIGTTTETDDTVQGNSTELRLVARGVYQCRDGKNSIFADEENRTKYHDCVQIRAPQYEQIKTDVDDEAQPSCSGAIVYAGSTYIFSDKEPCPIPEEVFKARNPIEANPEYYTQPK